VVGGHHLQVNRGRPCLTESGMFRTLVRWQYQVA
jgi:hypothetical protein